MTKTKITQSSGWGDPKRLLSTIKMTTTLGAVSLTLAGWGLLARVEARNAGQRDPVAQSVAMLTAAVEQPSLASQPISPGSLASAKLAALLPTATSTAMSTATPAPTATDAATATSVPRQIAAPAATATSQPARAKLSVVQWVQTNAGDPVAVVQDSGGTLWYVWGPDVDRIEQGLQPQYQPVPVNQVARSRHS